VKTEVEFEGETLTAMRVIEIKKPSQMEVKFVPNGGKFLLDSENEICFSACLNGEEGVGLPFKNGEIWAIDIKNKNKKLLQTINSNSNGRGKFRAMISKDFYYEFKIESESNVYKTYVLGPEHLGRKFEESITPIKLEIGSKVLEWGQDINLSFTKQKGQILEKFWVVFMDKMHVYFEKELTFPEKQTSLDFVFKLAKTKLKNGGVYQFQVYKSSNTKIMCQDVLVFVRPKKKLDMQVIFNRKQYAPGDEVKLIVHLPDRSKKMIGIVASDESAFLEIDEDRLPPSAFTKVFLENELLFRGKGNFPKAHYFIDWIFENNEEYLKKILNENVPGQSVGLRTKELGLLLGLQDWRLFLFEEMKLSKLIYNAQLSEKANLELVKKLFVVDPFEIKKNLPSNLRRAHHYYEDHNKLYYENQVDFNKGR
jgi:hypothetical protein